jgi:hypothetical protein
MAKIMYQNEKNLLLEPREAFYRPFNFGEWTEMRIGMLFRLVSTASDSGSIITESISVNNDSDKVYIGLKDSGSNMPGVSGTNFIGMASFTGSGIRSDGANPSYVSFGDYGNSFYHRLYLTAFSGSNMYRAYFYEATNLSPQFSGSASGSNYNGFYGVKFTLLNSGSANQQVQVQYKRTYLTLVGSSSADLHSHIIDNSGWTNPPASSTASWATGIPLPNSFFVYSPFYNNRLRMAAIEAIKIS